MDRLKKYDFLDENGHSLEDCADYQAIFSEHEAELARVKAVGIEALRRAEQAEAENERLTKALETQRNLTASAHAAAQAAWGGEIQSPFPGHKPPSEDTMVERFNHLNCPLCGGSGHIDDCDQTSAETIARLTKMVDWLAMNLSGYDAQKKCTVYAADWKEAASRAVAAGEE